MYHEKQSRQMCLLHALNALLQKPAFTKEHLDEICYSMNDSRWMNPHKSWIGLGNYDANVLMAAAALHDLKVTWFDARSDPARIRLDRVHAFIFNVPSKSMVPFMSGRHWFTVLKGDDGNFVNLDSKLSSPEPVEDVLQLTRDVLSRDNNQLMLVSRQGEEGEVVEK